jgi:hypothetical protein
MIILIWTSGNSNCQQTSPDPELVQWRPLANRHKLYVKCGGGQNTTILLVVIKQHFSAYSEAIFRFTKC